METRLITPPRLKNINISKKIVCHRPMRFEGPAMYVENIGSKVVAHNYGHGGSGWALAPGSAKYVIDQLEQHRQSDTTFSHSTGVTIIGAGVIGLFSALELVSRGYLNINVIAENFEDLASHKAGGLITQASMKNSPKMQKIVDLAGIESYKYYLKAIYKQNHLLHGTGKILPAYFLTKEESGLESYVGKVIKPAKEVILDFQNGTTRKMFAYDDGLFVYTKKVIDILTKYLSSRVNFQQKKLHYLEEVTQNIIINCAGLGSKELCKDDKMISVQGHLLLLKDQTASDLQYLLLAYSNTHLTENGFSAKESFYIFPKINSDIETDTGVIGGTFIEGADINTPHEEEFELVLKNAREFYGVSNL